MALSSTVSSNRTTAVPVEIFAHSLEPRPVYQLFVYARPSSKGKGRATYVDAVRAEAKRRIDTPIDSADVEVSILYSSVRNALQRLDIDNTLKPTLDALCGIAFTDDRQVQAVTARLIDRSAEMIELGAEDRLGRYLFNAILNGGDEVVIVHVFSDKRLEWLGREATEGRLTAEGKEEDDAVRRRVLAKG